MRSLSIILFFVSYLFPANFWTEGGLFFNKKSPSFANGEFLELKFNLEIKKHVLRIGFYSPLDADFTSVEYMNRLLGESKRSSIFVGGGFWIHESGNTPRLNTFIHAETPVFPLPIWEIPTISVLKFYAEVGVQANQAIDSYVSIGIKIGKFTPFNEMLDQTIKIFKSAPQPYIPQKATPSKQKQVPCVKKSYCL